MKTQAPRPFGITRSLSEVDLKLRTAKVLIITEGMGNLKDKNFYTADAIRSAARVFNGKRFFLDHPSRSDEEDRPERSVRDLAGYFYETQLGTVKDPDTGESLAACYAKLKFAESQPGNLALGQVLAALEYQQRFPDSKDVYCGISINGGGISHPGEIKGVEVNMVTEIQEAFSADIVTMPARGGKFLAMVSESVKRAGKETTTARAMEGLKDLYAAWDSDVEKALRIFRKEARRIVREGKRGDRRLGRLVESALRALGSAGAARKGDKA